MVKEEAGEISMMKAAKAVSAKRPTKKKPKDKPKRPLSAYNYFFKEEREKIIKLVSAEEGVKVENDPEADDFISDEDLSKLKKDGGKVSFEYMGKLIGQRWKNIDPDRLNKFAELAAEDTERYKKEMVSYNSRQEAKMRTEALKPPTSYTGRSDAKGDRSVAPAGYPDMGMNAAYGSAGMVSGAYPYGMDFSGYGMGMYGYGGGYAMGGAGGGGVNPDMSRQQMQDPSQQYGSSMYGSMMGGGYPQGGAMGYGGGGPAQGGYEPPPQQGMDPNQGQGGMYQGGGYGGGQGWGQP